MVGSGGICKQRAASLLQVLLNPMLTHGKEGTGDCHLVINEWGGAWVVPSR
jgi:hypothetical protein